MNQNQKQLDKEGVIVIGLSMLALVIWMLFFQNQAYNVPVKPGNKDTIKNNDINKTSVSNKKKEPVDLIEKNKSPNISKPTDTNFSTLPKFKHLPTQFIENDMERVEIDPNSGKIIAISLKKYRMTDKNTPVVMCTHDIPPGTLSFTGDSLWRTVSVKIARKSDSEIEIIRNVLVTARHSKQNLFEIKHTWTLKKPYKINYKIKIKNIGKTEISTHFYVNAGSITPVKIIGGDHVRREVHYIDNCFLSGDMESISADSKTIRKTIERPVLWTSVSNKYFCLVLKTSEPITDGVINFRSKTEIMEKNRSESYYTISSALRIKKMLLAVNEIKSLSFQLYAGPKILKNLETFAPHATHIMRLSFFSWFEWISQMLLIGLNYLKFLCGSYGLSIILLTLIVRALFWPITQKANTSMRKMQKLQPQMQELRKRFADNPQELNKRMMQLYRENNVHPLGGCLPILLQIPVFLALYSTLDGSIQLRHASFLWAHDLSRPDTVATLFGIAINPLILIMTVTMIIQQMLTPTAADPVQQKMMYFLPIFMLIFLYSLPSGLTLYWSVSQIISIIQLLINKKLMKDEPQRSSA